MRFELGPFRLEVATAFGPRITGLGKDGGPELLAGLGPEVVIDHPAGALPLHGGHRVWASPEVPDVTYAPDDQACSVSGDSSSVVVTAPPDRAGISKSILVTRFGDKLAVESAIEVTRTLGGSVAAWSITQFPPGGYALVPLVEADSSPLPNRQLVLWPYTSLDDDRFEFRGGGLIVDARSGAPLKIGVGPRPGRLGYWRQGQLFVKELDRPGSGPLPDLGAAGQVFAGEWFCELESVGPLVAAGEGVETSVTEVWSVSPCPDLETAYGLVVEGA